MNILYQDYRDQNYHVISIIAILVKYAENAYFCMFFQWQYNGILNENRKTTNLETGNSYIPSGQFG